METTTLKRWFPRRKGRVYPELERFVSCSVIVRLYAKMGLHGYNLFQGKNFQFTGVHTYEDDEDESCFAPSSYFITFEAKDPALGLVQSFQTKVYEAEKGQLILCCRFTRGYGETITSFKMLKTRFPHSQINYHFLSHLMPQMPSQNPFQRTKRFYVLNKSEMQEYDDCIRLYLELAIATTVRNYDPHLSNLEILQVAIESTATEPTSPREGLRRGSDAIFYIRYKDHDADSIALVRRTYDEHEGRFILVGEIKSSDTIPNKVINRPVLFRPRLGVYKPWLKAFKVRRLGLARRGIR